MRFEFCPAKLLGDTFNLTLLNCSLSNEKDNNILAFQLEIQVVLQNNLQQSECNPIESQFGQEETHGRLNAIETIVKKTREIRKAFISQDLNLFKLDMNLHSCIIANLTAIFQQYHSLFQ